LAGTDRRGARFALRTRYERDRATRGWKPSGQLDRGVARAGRRKIQQNRTFRKTTVLRPRTIRPPALRPRGRGSVPFRDSAGRLAVARCAAEQRFRGASDRPGASHERVAAPARALSAAHPARALSRHLRLALRELRLDLGELGFEAR